MNEMKWNEIKTFTDFDNWMWDVFVTRFEERTSTVDYWVTNYFGHHGNDRFLKYWK